MTTSMRVFFVEGDCAIKRIPLSRYEKMTRLESPACFPEYAGRDVRCAELAVALEDRVPVAVVRAVYPLYRFDADGYLDRKHFEREMQLAVDSLPFDHIMEAVDPDAKTPIGRAEFAQRRREHEFTWKPSLPLERALLAAALRKGRA